MTGRYELPPIPASWPGLEAESRKPYFGELRAFLDEDAATHEIYPCAPDVFRALELTPLRDVRVLLLGQDPYHGAGQAHGLAFSVQRGIKPPASLRNMFKELHQDLGIEPPTHGSLTAWAERGVLLLNAVLTVRAGEPNSHRGRGWELFTDEVIRLVNAKQSTVVFALWGAYAQKKKLLIDTSRHVIVTAAHPSPLSAHNGFLGAKPFSRINNAVVAGGGEAVDWELPK